MLDVRKRQKDFIQENFWLAKVSEASEWKRTLVATFCIPSNDNDDDDDAKDMWEFPLLNIFACF